MKENIFLTKNKRAHDRPYRQEITLDLGVLVLVARCDASHETNYSFSTPTTLPQLEFISEHLASLAECFLCSAATAAASDRKAKDSRLATEPIRS